MDAAHGLKLTSRTLRTLVVGLAYPVGLYALMDTFMRMGWRGSTLPGLLVLISFTAVSCGICWLVVRPERIRWFRWPWWTYALLAAGWLVRAWFLLETLPARTVLAYMFFYAVAVGFQEEFIFRGCLEEGLGQFGPVGAAVAAGLFFGLSHAPAAMLKGSDMASAVLGWLGAGVLYQFVMRWVRDKSGLMIPMLIHGLMDFMGAP